MKHRDQIRAWVLGMAGACALTTTQAHQPQSEKAPGAASAATETHALRAVRDKATGKLRAPTADELKAMEQAERAARKAQGLPEAAAPAPVQVMRRADGTLAARLGPEYLITLKAERRPDGSVRQFHDDPAMVHPATAPRNALPTE